MIEILIHPEHTNGPEQFQDRAVRPILFVSTQPSKTCLQVWVGIKFLLVDHFRFHKVQQLPCQIRK
jgi:hypothetical protein